MFAKDMILYIENFKDYTHTHTHTHTHRTIQQSSRIQLTHKNQLYFYTWTIWKVNYKMIQFIIA